MGNIGSLGDRTDGSWPSAWRNNCGRVLRRLIRVTFFFGLSFGVVFLVLDIGCGEFLRELLDADGVVVSLGRSCKTL